MSLTPHTQLQQWLLVTLGDMGGSASRAQALARIETNYSTFLTPDDLDSPASRPFETKWRNRVSWQRAKMVEEGLLHPFDGVGAPWSLTEDGWREFDELRSTPGPYDQLANFQPKDSNDYVARVRAQQLIKGRSHEALIADFGSWCATRGFTPETTVHPCDLVLRRGNELWLVEAKIIYFGNATEAVRAALAQLLMYRYFFYRRSRLHVLALFSEFVGHAYVGFLEAEKVASAWRLGAENWAFSASAASLEE